MTREKHKIKLVMKGRKHLAQERECFMISGKMITTVSIQCIEAFLHVFIIFLLMESYPSPIPYRNRLIHFFPSLLEDDYSLQQSPDPTGLIV
jgi:hypothetical protein